jgi:hypothetical protein
MRSRNLIRAIREGWLTESEIQQMQEGVAFLRGWLSGAQPDPLQVFSSFSVLYLYALSGEIERQQVENLCRFLSTEDPGAEPDPSTYPMLDRIWADLQENRVGTLLEKINAKSSLSHSQDPMDYVSALDDRRLEGLYENKLEGQNIDFFVQKLPFPLEVLDPRIVRIPPGKTNELHRHAHETVFIFFKGTGHVKVDEVRIPAKEGDFVFIPRWCRHQSVNEGPDEMVFLAVADFGLTGKSFFGNYLKTARLKPSTN